MIRLKGSRNSTAASLALRIVAGQTRPRESLDSSGHQVIFVVAAPVSNPCDGTPSRCALRGSAFRDMAAVYHCDNHGIRPNNNSTIMLLSRRDRGPTRGHAFPERLWSPPLTPHLPSRLSVSVGAPQVEANHRPKHYQCWARGWSGNRYTL